RKRKQEKHTFQVVINGVPITVTLSPPAGRRTSWFVYWTGLTYSRATGERELDKAIVAAEHMVRYGGKRADLDEVVLSDEEFEAIQKAHFGKKKDPDARRRAAKTLKDCLEAIAAFKALSGLDRVAAATPADCGKFQQKALTMPKNWRHRHAKE